MPGPAGAYEVRSFLLFIQNVWELTTVDHKIACYLCTVRLLAIILRYKYMANSNAMFVEQLKLNYTTYTLTASEDDVPRASSLLRRVLTVKN